MHPTSGVLGDPLYAIKGITREKRDTIRLFVTEQGLQRGITAIKKEIAKGEPGGPVDFKVYTAISPQWEERSERAI